MHQFCASWRGYKETMKKLSEKLRGLTVRSDIIKLAEDYEAEQEKRVAELEAQLSSSRYENDWRKVGL